MSSIRVPRYNSNENLISLSSSSLNRRVCINNGRQPAFYLSAATGLQQAFQVQGEAPPDLPLAAPSRRHVLNAADALRGGGAHPQAREQPQRTAHHPPARLVVVHRLRQHQVPGEAERPRAESLVFNGRPGIQAVFRRVHPAATALVSLDHVGGF